ncbi:unnamed protein product [Eruca vesicaria subsp. sativa]|uniref:Uncharacterized protein n=1 Tax=Eruca vesicaria subsp. sativa TaxID=29727 RepID=A0ABC8M5M8_ERUVS|nr:unnamed protein product [Eruca vesicaria subsp. sativa]
MGLSSLSPATSTSLTTSLSRRLRTSSSLKNVSTGVLNFPMFGANIGRKRSGSGQGNKNVEPSSPKVTCIGQVRVKTRKHVKKKLRARSRRESQTSLRRSSSSDQNDGSGRRFDGSENRWVHIPVSICESLRTLGSELNCLFPCRSSCTDHSHHERGRDENNSCGAVFTRWFVAVEETGREIELVVGGEEDMRRRRRSSRRHVFENLDLSIIETKTCPPPKNALLLMRCRSDPVKVAALANRVRERQMSLNDVAYGRDEEEEKNNEKIRFELDDLEDKKRIELCNKRVSDKIPVTEPEDMSEEEETEAMIIKTIEDNIKNAIEEEERKEVKRSDQEPDQSLKEKDTTPYKVLPDCLLLMMCEPKLSMEVSKETWVCTTDFVRSKPGRPPAKKIPEPPGDLNHQETKKRIVTAVESNSSSRRRSVDKRPVHRGVLQPPRSSCSYPAAPPVITAVGEEKVEGAKELSVLPRCNSEPRKSGSKLAPESCLWKNRKMETHSPVTVGIGAAGVGF